MDLVELIMHVDKCSAFPVCSLNMQTCCVFTAVKTVSRQHQYLPVCTFQSNAKCCVCLQADVDSMRMSHCDVLLAAPSLNKLNACE